MEYQEPACPWPCSDLPMQLATHPRGLLAQITGLCCSRCARLL